MVYLFFQSETARSRLQLNRSNTAARWNIEEQCSAAIALPFAAANKIIVIVVQESHRNYQGLIPGWTAGQKGIDTAAVVTRTADATPSGAPLPVNLIMARRYIEGVRRRGAIIRILARGSLASCGWYMKCPARRCRRTNTVGRGYLPRDLRHRDTASLFFSSILENEESICTRVQLWHLANKMRWFEGSARVEASSIAGHRWRIPANSVDGNRIF